jgi:hypothetical protein
MPYERGTNNPGSERAVRDQNASKSLRLDRAPRLGSIGPVPDDRYLREPNAVMTRNELSQTARRLQRQLNARCPLNVETGRPASKIFYVDTLATTILAISGLSRQTPSAQMMN